MFWNVFRTDCRRWLRPGFFAIAMLCAAILMLGQADEIWTAPLVDGGYSVIFMLEMALGFDKFKVVVVILLAGIYGGSFCADENTSYLRMILARTDIGTYAASRFLANGAAIVSASVVGFLSTAALSLLPSLSLALPEDDSSYYYDLARGYPLLYLVIMGLQFGMVAAACSSIGLMFSAFQANRFVSIVLPGLAFYILVSYIPMESVFDMFAVVAMWPTFIKDPDGGQAVNLAWGLLYPAMIAVTCGYVFYRRMEWRMENGKI